MNSLAFTPLEHFFYESSCPAHPLHSVLVFEFSGSLKREILTEVIRELSKRHPLATAPVVTSKYSGSIRRTWNLAQAGEVEVEWEEVADASQFSAVPVGASAHEDDRLKLFISVSPHQSRLLLSSPHARMDGKAFAQLTDELLVLYANRENGSQPLSLDKLEPEALHDRQLPDRDLSELIRHPHQLWSRIGIILQTLARNPVRLSSKSGVNPKLAASSHQSTHQFSLTLDELKQYRRQGQLNDLLIRDLFLAVHDWREQRGLGHRNDWLRIAVPLDCRPAKGCQLPACNSMSMAFFDRQALEFTCLKSLKKSIHDQMKAIRTHKFYDLFILSLNLYYWLEPLLIQLGFRQPDLGATICLSNLGRVSRISRLPREAGKVRMGSHLLERVFAWTPNFPGVDASFCMLEYAGKLHAHLRYDPHALSTTDAQELSALFQHYISKSFLDSEV